MTLGKLLYLPGFWIVKLSFNTDISRFLKGALCGDEGQTAVPSDPVTCVRFPAP